MMAMSDLKKHISKRKKKETKFVLNYESGYQEFVKLADNFFIGDDACTAY